MTTLVTPETPDWPWKNFQRHELECHCGCGQMKMDPWVMYIVQGLRDYLGFPLCLSSAYRCPRHDRAVRSKRGQESIGFHTRGTEVDVHRLTPAQLYRLVDAALDEGVTGVGFGKTFVHLGWGKRPTPRVIWTY